MENDGGMGTGVRVEHADEDLGTGVFWPDINKGDIQSEVGIGVHGQVPHAIDGETLGAMGIAAAVGYKQVALISFTGGTGDGITCGGHTA